MQIVYRSKFVNEVNNIFDYIALDSKNRANKFTSDLKKKIESIPFMPYKHRQSIYFESEDIRDLIFKGYVTPYKIDKSKNQIIIIGINKYKGNL